MRQLMPERKHRRQNNKHERQRPTQSPKVRFAFRSVDDALEVHAEIRGKKGKREEDDGHAGEDEDGFVLGIGHDC